MANSNKNRDSEAALRLLNQQIRSGELTGAYAFFGEEQYLLQNTLLRIRAAVVQEDFAAFNHRVLPGKGLDLAELSEAVEAFPAFSEKTLIEVDDLELGKMCQEDKETLLQIISDLPDYAVLIFRFETEEFKLDGRVKTDAALKKLMKPVEFRAQAGSQLTRWIISHVEKNGCRISPADADYFAFYAGSLMANLNTEIDKVCAASEGVVTRQEIEANATPVLEAAVYHVTDAVLGGDYRRALDRVGLLLDLNNEPRMVFAVLSSSLKQLYVAKLVQSYRLDVKALQDLLGIQYDFVAKRLMDGARRRSSAWCSDALQLCVDTAYRYNTAAGLDDALVLTDLVIKLAVLK